MRGVLLQGMDARVTYELRDGVAVVTMDDGKVNALGPALIGELDAALDRAEEEATAVVLAGREGKFSAGFDIKVLMSGAEPGRALVDAGLALWLRLYAFPKPVVAACTGHALAGGALLLLVSDVRIGREGAFKIGLNEVAIGIRLPILAHGLARDRLNRARYTEATLCAKVYDPRTAVDVGFLDRVVGEEAVVDEAVAEAKRLGAHPATAFSGSKASIREQTLERIRSTLEADIEALVPRG